MTITASTMTGVFMYAYAIFYFNLRSEMSGFLQGTITLTL
jgi:hypothetical protein